MQRTASAPGKPGKPDAPQSPVTAQVPPSPSEAQKPTQKPASPPPVDKRKPVTAIPGAGSFITCLLEDDDGRVWVGAEEHGLARLSGGELLCFTKERGLLDDSPFAMAADAAGRLWVGNRTEGLSVFDGEAWRHLTMRHGLNGVRVYDIAVDARTGTVWCATENGVCAYDGESWRHFSTWDGLPLGEISALATGVGGRVWAAGAAGGLATWDGRRWRQYPCDTPLRERLINDVHISRDGCLWVATTAGVFRRGIGKRAGRPPMQRRRTETVAGQPEQSAWTHYEPSKALKKGVPEDYVTCIAEDADGRLLFGTRKSGVLIHDPGTAAWRAISTRTHKLPDNYVGAVLPSRSGTIWVGTYGYGLFAVGGEKREIKARDAALPAVPPGPLGAPPPLAVTRRWLCPPDPDAEDKPVAAYLGEDWQTQGDWIGHYGNYAFILPAMGTPYDFAGGPGAPSLRYRPTMGHNRKPGDSLRYWTHWKKTDDPKCLQNPVANSRRQSSWDDAGELYPPTQDGPHVYIDLDLPALDFLVSFYFVNIDCLDCPKGWRTQDRLPYPNRFRDYVVDVRAGSSGDEDFNRKPSLARCRVHDFASGVYKRFFLKGDRYTIRITRNASHNTIVSGVFIDSPPQFTTLAEIPSVPRAEPALFARHDSIDLLAPRLGALWRSGPVTYSRALLFAGPTMLAEADRRHRAFVSPGPEGDVSPEPLGAVEAIAEALWSARLFNQSASAMSLLAEMHAARVGRLTGEAQIQARQYFAERSLSLWDRTHEPFLAGFREYGWEPLAARLVMARSLVRVLAETDRGALKTLALQCSRDPRHAAVAELCWAAVATRGAEDTLSAWELQTKARHYLALRRPGEASRVLRLALSKAAGTDEEATCARLLAHADRQTSAPPTGSDTSAVPSGADAGRASGKVE